MGRGFGRGAKSVAIVTHAQVKNAKKVPKGLKITRKSRRRQYRKEAEAEDPDSMMDTGDSKKNQGKTNSKKKIAPKSVEQQIAGIDFQTLVPRGKKLKVLRKQLVSTVKNIRRRDHQKKESRAKNEVNRIAKMNKRKKRLEERKASAAAAGKKK